MTKSLCITLNGNRSLEHDYSPFIFNKIAEQPAGTAHFPKRNLQPSQSAGRGVNCFSVASHKLDCYRNWRRSVRNRPDMQYERSRKRMLHFDGWREVIRVDCYIALTIWFEAQIEK